ncbi:MAG: hypothetical protein FJ091_11080 [Deltaproteobacteria bacterium]|nr:hypothetical protein [Deltaproteobacteria bacterium]
MVHAADWALRGGEIGALALAVAYGALAVWMRVRTSAAPLVASAGAGVVGTLLGLEDLTPRGFAWIDLGTWAGLALVGVCAYQLITGELHAAARLQRADELEAAAAEHPRPREPRPATTQLTFVLLAAAYAVALRLAPDDGDGANMRLAGLLHAVLGIESLAVLGFPFILAALTADRVRDVTAARLIMLACPLALSVIAAAAHTLLETREYRGGRLFLLSMAIVVPLPQVFLFVGAALGTRSQHLAKLGRAEWPL